MSTERSDAVRLGALGAISGAVSWALVWVTKDIYPAFLIPSGLWPASFAPGLVFGVVVGTVLLLRGRFSDPGWLEFVFTSCLTSAIVLNGAIYAFQARMAWLLVSFLVAGLVFVVVPVKYVRAPPIVGRVATLVVVLSIAISGMAGGPTMAFTEATGLLAGLLGGYLLGVGTAYAIRDSSRYVLLLPVMVCGAAGAAFSFTITAGVTQWQLAGFFILWHAAYAASLAPLSHVGGVPEASVITPVSPATYRAIGFQRQKMTSRERHDAIRLGILGAISGYAASWAMAFVGLRLHNPHLLPLIKLLAAFAVPGLVFGLIVGGFLCVRGKLTPSGLIAYVAASGFACSVAGSVPVCLFGGTPYWLVPPGILAFIVLVHIFKRTAHPYFQYAPMRPFSFESVFFVSAAILVALGATLGGWVIGFSFMGLLAGFFGSWLLGMATAFLIRAPNRLVLSTPIVVGTAAGALFPLISYEDALRWGPLKMHLLSHYLPHGFSVFLVLWQAAYAASLVSLLHADANEGIERPDDS